MTALGGTAGLRYLCLEPAGAVHLVASPGTPEEQRIAFCRMLEIGRDEESREAMPGLLLLDDSLVSRCHCVLTRSPDGRCWVRDVSVTGTGLSGRWLPPNADTEIRPGEILTIAGRFHFTLEPPGAGAAPRLASADTSLVPRHPGILASSHEQNPHGPHLARPAR